MDDDLRYISKYQAKTNAIIAFMLALFIGFGLGIYAEYSRSWGNNERLFNLLRSEDVARQACAEVAIKNNEPYNWEFIKWCLKQANDAKGKK